MDSLVFGYTQENCEYNQTYTCWVKLVFFGHSSFVHFFLPPKFDNSTNNNSKFALITKTTYVSFGWPLLLGFQITDLFLPEDISHIRCCVTDIYARNLQAAVGTRREGLRRDTHVGGPSGYQGISSK